MAKKIVKPSEKARQAEQAKAQATTENRAVRYPFPMTRIHCKNWEKLNEESKSNLFAPPITAGEAKKLLGWQTESEYLGAHKRDNPAATDDDLKKLEWKKQGVDYFLTDKDGQKVRLLNNPNNRPWVEGVSHKYMSDILNKHWEFNGENVIIGKTGCVLSAQHRLIGLVFAEQLRTSEKEKEHWKDVWKEPCYIETSAIYGISEDPKVRRTIDNVKPRTLTDVLFADTSLLGKYNQSERKELARMVDFAVRTLWKRLGITDDQWVNKRTHSESLDFIDRHKTILECVAHLYDENKGKEGRLDKKYLYSGTAAALMYLMATGKTKNDCEDYHGPHPKNEVHLDFSLMKKAKHFWSELVREDESLRNLRLCRRPAKGDVPDDGFSGYMFPEPPGKGEIVLEGQQGGNVHERMNAIIKAWNAYSTMDDEEFAKQRFELDYDFDLNPEDDTTIEHGTLKRESYIPIIGADLGDAPKVKKEKEPKAEGGDGEPDNSEFEPANELSDEEGDKRVAAKAKKGKAKELSRQEQWEADKKEHDGLLFYESQSGNYLAVCADADEVSNLLKVKKTTHSEEGYSQVVLTPEVFEEKVQYLIDEEGKNCYVIHDVDGERQVTDAEVFFSGENQTEESDGEETEEPDVESLLEDEDEGIEDDETEETEEEETEPVKPRRVVRKPN